MGRREGSEEEGGERRGGMGRGKMKSWKGMGRPGDSP